MPEVETKAFGKMEIGEDRLFEFPDGLLGFQEYKKFAIIVPEDSPFKWLQSMDDVNLAFIIIHPDLFMKNGYHPDVLAGELSPLKVNSIDECTVYLIVTIPENRPEDMTANLQGPLLINEEKRIGRQVISVNDSHKVRVPILEQMSV